SWKLVAIPPFAVRNSAVPARSSSAFGIRRSAFCSFGRRVVVGGYNRRSRSAQDFPPGGKSNHDKVRGGLGAKPNGVKPRRWLNPKARKPSHRAHGDHRERRAIPPLCSLWALWLG